MDEDGPETVSIAGRRSSAADDDDDESLKELIPPAWPELEAADENGTESAPRDWSRVILLCVALNSAVVASSISLLMPFFAGEALKKVPSGSRGLMNNFVIGMVFSIATFVEFLAAPLMAKDLPHAGSKLMLVLSTMEICALLLLFSFVNRIGSWSVFLTLCMAIRFFQGIATAGYFVSSFSVLIGAYPESKGFVNGVLRAANGFGYAIGPVVGGVLYDWGGFALPFYVGGAMLFVDTAMLIILLPSSESELSSTELKKDVSFMRLLKVPWVWMVLLSLFLANMIMGFVEPTLAVYLKESFNLSAAYAGYGFFIFSVFYSGIALPVGHLIDKWLNPSLVQAAGLIFCGIGCQLVGPAPFLPFGKSLAWCYFAMMLFGLSSGFSLVSASPDLMNTLHSHGLGSPGELRAAVAGLFQATLALGYGTGPIAGSTLTAAVGFQYSTSIVGAVYLVWGVVFSIGALKSDTLLMLQLKNFVRS